MSAIPTRKQSKFAQCSRSDEQRFYIGVAQRASVKLYLKLLCVATRLHGPQLVILREQEWTIDFLRPGG